MGCVLEQQAFQYRTGYAFLLWRELAHGLELQTQILIGSAFTVLEQQLIGGDAETLGDLLKRVGAEL